MQCSLFVWGGVVLFPVFTCSVFNQIFQITFKDTKNVVFNFYCFAMEAGCAMDGFHEQNALLLWKKYAERTFCKMPSLERRGKFRRLEEKSGLQPFL